MCSIMIDLETLGTSPTSVILQIGVAVFDHKARTLDVDASFSLKPDIDEQFVAGRTIDAGTLKWWSDQSPAARKEAFDEPSFGMFVTAKQFAASVEAIHPAEVWAHGAAFDLAIMRHFLGQTKTAMPWDFHIERDTRTLYALAKSLGVKWNTAEPSLAHTALSDAFAQAKTVNSVFSALVAQGMWRAEA